MKSLREYIENEPGRTVVVRHRVAERFDFQWHHHPEMELTLIVAGHGTRLVGDSLGNFGPGDLVLLGPSLPHTWISEPSPAAPVEAYYVHFSRADLGGWRETAELDYLLNKSQRGLEFGTDLAAPRSLLERAAHAKGLLQTMIYFLGSLAALAEEAESATPITTAAYEMSARVSRPSSPNIESRLETVHEMITHSFPQKLDFGLVAERVGMSEAGFSRFFRRATGMTFTTYVQELRISEACRLLRETELTVNYVAHNSGFGSLTQFNRIFRKLKDCTPSQWRQQTTPNLEIL